ncbi:MAG: hypothetical protein JKY37_10950, partial [Nannocystaceae bacterium]|nr:hypothetical protein [Nannocystaceae bacterium]
MIHQLERFDDAGEVDSPAQYEVWATGRCGESPVLLSAEQSMVFFYEDQWPRTPLACRIPATDDGPPGDIVVLDAYEGGVHNVLFPGVGCWPARTDHGVVTSVSQGDGTDSVFFYPFPDDPLSGPVTPLRIVDGVAPKPGGVSKPVPVKTTPNTVFALRSDHTLGRFDLPDGDLSTELTNVRHYDVSQDGRYILWQDLDWQDLAPTDGDEDHPTGRVSLR